MGGPGGRPTFLGGAMGVSPVHPKLSLVYRTTPSSGELAVA
jgi:hypothetical protein